MGGKGSGAKPKHGMRGTKFYNVWRNIKARCKRPIGSNIKYVGISYPEKWEMFEGFYEDMFLGYKEGLEIDRINPSANYSKENCRWVDETVQSCNKQKKENASTEFYGVSIHKKTGKYQAEIRAYGKRYYGGIFTTALEAAQKVNKIILDNNLPNRKNAI